MDFRKIFPILVIFISLYLTIASAKKSEKAKPNDEIQLKFQEDQVEGISKELQVLKDLNSKNGTTSVKKPKHRRKNKHHQRGSHNRRAQLRSRVHHKKRTNPTDILTAEDEFMPKSNRTTTRSGKNRNASTNIKSSNPSRGTRHLENEREFTNGHSAGNLYNAHKHHHKHHRLGRRRFHHKKHKKVITPANEQPTLESPTLQDISPSAIIP